MWVLFSYVSFSWNDIYRAHLPVINGVFLSLKSIHSDTHKHTHYTFTK